MARVTWAESWRASPRPWKSGWVLTPLTSTSPGKRTRTGHGGQAPLDADAGEASHGVGSRQKGAGLGEAGQGQHLAGVVIAQDHHRRVARHGLQRPRGHHLHDLALVAGFEPGGDHDVRHLG